MIPSAFLPDGFGKTLQEIENELLRRAEMKGSFVRTGHPDASRLPDEPISVWLAPKRMFRDPQQPFIAGMYISEWFIYVVRKETGADEFSSSYKELFGDLDAVLFDLIGTHDDLCLDGAVDWIVDPNIEFTEGDTAGGDRRFVAATLNIEAHHPLFPIRQND